MNTMQQDNLMTQFYPIGQTWANILFYKKKNHKIFKPIYEPENPLFINPMWSHTIIRNRKELKQIPSRPFHPHTHARAGGKTGVWTEKL